MKMKRGSTSIRRLIFIADTSQTDGSGLTNLLHNSSGLVAYYFAGDLSNEVQITLVTATLGTYTSGGFIAVDNTNMPGWYEIGIPDAALDGGNEVAIQFRGAANMAPVNIYIELDAVNYQVDAFGAVKPTVAGRTLDISAGGEAGIDLANVGSPTTTLDLSGTTISTSQTVASVSGNVGGNVVGSVGSVTSGVTVTTNNDKENYGLSATALTDIASAVWSAASRTLTGFGSLVTDVANAVWSAGTRTLTAFGFNVTVGGYAAGQSPPSANDIRDAVMNADPNGGWADGSFGDRWLISANNTRNLAITGSGHIAAVLHDAEPNSIPEDAFFTGAFSARVLADDAATEIATAVGNLQVLSRLDSMIESDGNGQFRFDTIALSMAASASSTDWTANERTAIRSILGIPASGTTPADPSVGILDTIRDGVNSIGINVYPVTSSTPERVNGTTITVYKDEQTNVTISTTATLTGLTLRFVAEDRTGADVLVVENASFVARTATSVTLQIPSSVTDEIASYTWTLRDVTTGNSVLARGVLSVQAAASKNA